MVNFVVLNELSLPIGNDLKEAEENIKKFIKLLRELKPKNIDTVRCLECIKNINVTPTKKIYEYLPSIEDRDLRTRVMSMISNNIVDFENPLYNESEIDYTIEYKYGDKIAEGLGASDIFETLSISFDSDSKWRHSYLSISQDYINEAGEIEKKEGIKVRNISCKESISFFSEYFENLFSFKFSINKKNFSELKNKAFQRIKFCDKVDEQVRGIDSTVFKIFLQKLKVIELGLKQITDFNYSNESKTVRERFFLERTFYHEDLGNQYFENHIKSFPEGNRMYFFEKEQYIYIGYIGKHLRTKKNN